MNPLEKLLPFLFRLQNAKIQYRLDRVRAAIMVEVFMPAEHWEVELFPDSHVEVEVYRGDGAHVPLEGEEALDRLFSAESK